MPEAFKFCCKAKKTIDEKQLYLVIQSEFQETLKYINIFENIIQKYLLSGEINLTDFIKESEPIAKDLYQQFKNDIIGTKVEQIVTHKNSVEYNNNNNYITSSDLVKSKFHQYMEIIRLCSEQIRKHLQEYHQYYEKPDNTLWDWVL